MKKLDIIFNDEEFIKFIGILNNAVENIKRSAAQQAVDEMMPFLQKISDSVKNVESESLPVDESKESGKME